MLWRDWSVNPLRAPCKNQVSPDRWLRITVSVSKNMSRLFFFLIIFYIPVKKFLLIQLMYVHIIIFC